MTNSLKILATSDLHGFLDGFTDEIRQISPDVVVLAGDISPCMFGVSPIEFIKNELFNVVKQFPNVKFVYTPGNHDYFSQQWDKFSSEVPENFIFLLDEVVEISGFSFYGTPWVPHINGMWAYECQNEDEEYEHFKNIPENIDVLITHGPPKFEDSTVDISLQHSIPRHFGSKHLANEILKKHPMLIICGHIHSGDHRLVQIDLSSGKCINNQPQTEIPKNKSSVYMLNVSRVDERYAVTYKMAKLTLRR